MRPSIFAGILLASGLSSLACVDAGGPAAPRRDKAAAAEAANDGKADWSFDICGDSGWYGDGECDWFCPRPDPDCNLPPLGPDPQGSATRYPILLVHGFNASPTHWGFDPSIADALRGDGHAVAVADLPPYQPLRVRGPALAAAIDRTLAQLGARKVNIVAHSMGGLDARVAISTLGYGDRVASVTTIGTPHRGSWVADVALALVPGFAEGALNALASLLGRSYSDVANDSDLLETLHDLAESSADAFNARNPDDARVYYQSWAGISSVLGLANAAEPEVCDDKLLRHPGTADHMHALLSAVAAFVVHGTAFRPSDGMVTVQSAKWAHFQGCVPADHLRVVGILTSPGRDPYTSFEATRFYRNVVYDLAARGF